MLDKLGEEIWGYRYWFKIMGTDFLSLMTIVRVRGNTLIIISPCEIDEALKKQISDLGNVAYIISPNNFHHLYAKSAVTAFPSATYLTPPGLPKRIKDLPASTNIREMDFSGWADEFKMLAACPSHMADETVFLHKKSRSLILTDLLMYYPGKQPLTVKIFSRIFGVRNNLGMSRLFRFLLRDKEELKQAYEIIMTWDFDRILLAHNTNVDHDGKNEFSKAMKKVLDIQ